MKTFVKVLAVGVVGNALIRTYINKDVRNIGSYLFLDVIGPKIRDIAVDVTHEIKKTKRERREETPVTFAGDPNETPAAMFERLADKTPPSIEIQVERFGRSKAFAFHKNVKD